MTVQAVQRRYPLIAASLFLPFVIFSAMQSAVAPALLTIQSDLHASTEAAAWILTSFLLSASVAAPILGRLGDMFGKKRLLLVSLAIFAGGCLWAALAGSIATLIAARFVQGTAGAIFPLSIGIIRDEAPPNRMLKDVALFSALTGIGGALGVLLAGPIVAQLGYQYLFWLPLIFVGVSLPLAVLAIPESANRSRGRVDVAGALLLSAWLIALLVAVTEGRTWSWTSGRILGLLAAAVLLLLLWVVVENRSREPLVDMRMLGLRGVWSTNLVALILGFGGFATFILLPQLVQLPHSAGGLAASVTGAGLFMLPATVCSFAAGPVAGRIAERAGPKLPVALGMAVASLALLLLVFAHTASWEVYLGSGAMGIGFGLAYASLGNLIIAAVPGSQTSVAAGMNAIVRTVGGSIGALAMASVLAGSAVAGSSTQHGFTVGFAITAVVLAVGFAVAFAAVPGRLRSRRPLGEAVVEPA